MYDYTPPIDQLRNALLGRQILHVIPEDKEGSTRLYLDATGFHPKQMVVVNYYSDCCSETWVADVSGYDALGGIVRDVISLDENIPSWVNTEDGRGKQNYDQAYGYQIVTDKGRCDLIYRNSSNGYYGGNMSGASLHEWDGVVPPDAITDDWSA